MHCGTVKLGWEKGSPPIFSEPSLFKAPRDVLSETLIVEMDLDPAYAVGGQTFYFLFLGGPAE